MIKRVIDISEQAYLHIQHKQLLIERNGVVIGQVAVEDLGVLILESPSIVLTQSVIIECQKNNVAVVFCDEKHLPYSIILPISEGHTLQTKIIAEQIRITRPTQKRLWKQVVQQKILHQADILSSFGKNPAPLNKLVSQIKSGDTENHEAQAAQKYWRLLMGKDFRRNPQNDGINALLNYGYAIMRAMVARAIVGGGLHPSIGLHHHNQYNGLCLADDLMEPFRPWVDREVYQINQRQENLVIGQENKTALLELLNQKVSWNNKTMPLMVASHYLVANFKLALKDRHTQLRYPSLSYIST